ncbi:MAG: hypothetical protein FD122_2873 [Stygiobacter sp.]|nr:MAG: hypothetical protein FD122_2873 [Stygiobacter sp.]KAF0213901.1 MAG: hypothetical protein FD178_2740 [Ignavibacteria bacterium]
MMSYFKCEIFSQKLYPKLISGSIKSMKKTTTKLSDKELVTAHIQNLESGLQKVIEAIRQSILSTDKEIGERIKWNNPSFYYTGEMKEFDPKEFKRELIIMNLFKNRIMLVFPSGAKVNDKSGLLEGEYKDGRRITVFKDIEDFKAKEKQLKKIIKDWLKLIEK